MKKHLANLVTAGLVAVGIGAAAPSGAAQDTTLDGTLRFESGAKIPKGTIEIFLEDPASGRLETAAAERVQSTGAETEIAFALPRPAPTISAPTVRIVARLERADGWLLARGSAKLNAGTATDITLFRAMY